MKIEVRGVDTATLEVPSAAASGAAVWTEGSTRTITHAQRGGQRQLIQETYAEFYYVPEIKNYAKSVEEQYNTDNVRLTRLSRVLIAYKPAE
jgi:hypothetical protein